MKITSKVAIGGHIHECLTKATVGIYSFNKLRSNDWEAREIQHCLVFGWLKQTRDPWKRTSYWITEHGYELLDLLGTYRTAYCKVDYTPAPRKALGFVNIPEHHTINKRWQRYFDTHVW